MAGGFQGSVEQFTQSEKRVTEVRVAMDQNLAKLRDNIEATRAGWTGDASVAFNNVMKRYNEAGQGLNRALQNIAELLEQAGSKYNASEQQQQELINSVNKGFGVLG
ncbi:WXG100 family type VII secretion target [Amycolatopsis oliviviridis]|uniref:ESAT-6-like protein n=1 Tax=Amycolatopsis oliviviridis TaxID=1471590 RepID=A0ABQ3LUS0_9PSEU|nr:WXG100 family type VII secretion target [Amycolatopsis oliviviridis]GHH26640.1 ESAT-6-like protein [Amycolatopsis oliviviridis]